MDESTNDIWTDSSGIEYWVHKRTADCDADGCAIHNQSYHHMVDWPTYMRVDKYYLIERICSHGIGHPDPDSLSFFRKKAMGWIGIHGCCRCCVDSGERNESGI